MPTVAPDEKNIIIFAYWHDKGWKQFVGATVKIWDLAHNIAAPGNHVVLFLPKYNFPANSLPFRLIQIPLLDYPFLRALSFNLFLAIYLIRNYFKLKPDAVYIRRGISIVPVIFAKLKKAVLLYEINDDPYSERIAAGYNPFRRFDCWLSLKTDEASLFLCDAAFVITREIKDKIIKVRSNINSEKLHILPSGTNTDLYKPLDQKLCRTKLNLNISGRHIGFMGTLLAHQGVDVLIDAAPSVLESFSDAVFVIIGEGPMAANWYERVLEKSLQNHFIFTGQVDYTETPLWINAMDICTAPFLSRAGLRSPVKIFDYMACGKPVVASRIPGTTDIFEGSNAIRLIEPENKELLAKAIVDVLNDPETANRMGMTGRKLVEKHFDRKVLTKEILNKF